MKICKEEICTGCGVCTNVCTQSAIQMKKGKHGFIYPCIDREKCVSCELCIKKCPANSIYEAKKNVIKVYAAWNKNENIRKRSTSGGVFSILAEKFLTDGGYVAGVRWSGDFCAEHILISNKNKLDQLYGSKYVQSITGNIYKQIKGKLDNGKKVLFSGTPCQNRALRLYLEKEYNNLYQVDLVCHGVPSEEMLKRYLSERIGLDSKEVVQIKFRHKKPYWNYCNVTVAFSDGSQYTVPTVDDSYFTMFNIGYSLRESCQNCNYTNLERHGDITLADFWGYTPSSFRMRNFNKGISCILVNSNKGEYMFESINRELIYEERTVEEAMEGNKSLYAPYTPPIFRTVQFWKDYDTGMNIDELCEKYTFDRLKKPSLLWLRNLKNRYYWAIKKLK